MSRLSLTFSRLSKYTLLSCLIAGGVFTGAAAQAARVTVTVDGIQTTDGAILAGLFDSAASFPQKYVQGQSSVAKTPSVTLTFENVAPGRYAMSAFHDRNGNGKLDTGAFGIPTEPLGFSRGARAIMGPPSFADAAFDVPAEGLSLVIHLNEKAPTAAQRNANERFWAALHGADYAAYPAALAAVQAALVESPQDPVQNAHLGWLHIWHLSEAGSFATTPQDMGADLASATRSFQHAVELAPDEARYLGFFATTLFLESAVNADAAGSRRAEAMMERAVQMWPEFNLFTAGYIHSSDPFDSPQYATAMQQMWQDLDVCAGQPISREHPGFAQPPVQTTVGHQRACWNSSIAPHNLEGFFLNFGDMLVKQGEVASARAMYANARLSATYAEWAYRDVLERRITDAEANVAVFRNSAGSSEGEAHMMVQSNFSCMACHRGSRSAST